jgi:hypothetical protein
VTRPGFRTGFASEDYRLPRFASGCAPARWSAPSTAARVRVRDFAGGLAAGSAPCAPPAAPPATAPSSNFGLRRVGCLASGASFPRPFSPPPPPSPPVSFSTPAVAATVCCSVAVPSSAAATWAPLGRRGFLTAAAAGGRALASPFLWRAGRKAVVRPPTVSKWMRPSGDPMEPG